MRDEHNQTFSTHDGVELFYRHWPASAPVADEPRKAILLFHRGHEHSGRIAHLVDELNLPEFDFFAWDARGHGQSPGARGDSPSFATSVRDVQRRSARWCSPRLRSRSSSTYRSPGRGWR